MTEDRAGGAESTGSHKRRGVAYYLRSGLAGLAGLTILVTALSVTFFYLLSGNLTTLTTEALPALNQANEMLRLVKTIDSDARSLVGTREPFLVESHLYRLELNSGLLGHRVQDANSVLILGEYRDELQSHLAILSETLARLSDLKRKEIEALASAEEQARGLLAMQERALRLGRLVAETADNERRTIPAEMEPLYESLGFLFAALTTDDLAEVAALGGEFAIHLSTASFAGKEIPVPLLGERAALVRDIDAMQIIFVERQKRIEVEIRLKSAIKRLAVLDGLLLRVEQIAARVTADSFEQTKAMELRTQKVTAVIVALSILCVAGALAILLYVNRRVVNRMRGLQQTMLSHVRNEPRAVDVSGDDEIADMARSFVYFVDEVGHREARLTERTRELDEKNTMLESLSAKLSKYLSPQIYQSIFLGRKDVDLVTQRKMLTIFFSDIKDFTKTTENLKPEELTYMLNSYFTEMSKIAAEYGATIDKFIGDAMLMFFGDPESKGVEEDALACVSMAAAMQRRMRKLQATWRFRGFKEPFAMRIGINSGFCNVGNFGSDDRMEYTIIGSEVNMAARLESVAEPGGILVSAETYRLVRDRVVAEERTGIRVKGIDREIVAYTVTSVSEDKPTRTAAAHSE